MKTITRDEYLFMARGDPDYYKGGEGLWQSRVAVCCEWLQAIPAEPERVIEIGPYMTPLVPGSAIMDLPKRAPLHQGRRFIAHDASKTPWPLRTGEFEIVIACAVWEHLHRNETGAFQEAARVAAWMLMLVPYEWHQHKDKWHNGVDVGVISRWTGGITPVRARKLGRKGWQTWLALYDLAAVTGRARCPECARLPVDGDPLLKCAYCGYARELTAVQG